MNDTLVAQRPLAPALDLQAFRWSQPVRRYAHEFAAVQSLFVGNTADTNDWRQALDRIEHPEPARRRFSRFFSDKSATATDTGDARAHPVGRRRFAEHDSSVDRLPELDPPVLSRHYLLYP